ncbi:MAG: Chromatin structure-remodeling complex protein rsc9 [Thelocarpon superellum]|nr:MAG: Chromatin structure-remodeling complex protein rsc9 [Thelocarpon superellum]
MAPPGRTREPSIEHTEEYDDFIAKLTAYHEQRGTNFDPRPRVGTRHIDLLRLFKAVVSKGGYDSVSSEKLAWRKLGQEYALGATNLPALAFSMKTVYYRNLAAYEISTVHGREPPPKEILEDISARGGDILNRTVENYKPHAVGRESTRPTNGEESDGLGDEERVTTPDQERGQSDDPGSGGRVTRGQSLAVSFSVVRPSLSDMRLVLGLRQAPPQRVLFQPDLSSSRQPRQHASNTQSPQPSGPPAPASLYNSSNPQSMSFTVGSYDPRPQMPLTLRPVVTPGNNPTLFKERQRALKDAQDTKADKDGKKAAVYKGMMLPGTGFEGPNVYVRTLLALRSGIPAEEDYALHHLVKISHERGDKFRFDAFPGLAEGLIEKALEVGALFYDVAWRIVYDEPEAPPVDALDGINSTADLLQRIQSLERYPSDSLETEDFAQKMVRINEAALVLRNMTMLEENAQYLARQAPIRDLITVALNLPARPAVVEMQHYALDMAEQLTKYYALGPDDPLYRSLLAQLDDSDRGAILTALRALSRISMNLDEHNRLDGIPLPLVERVSDWTMIDDEELVHACLDFLYQYTAVPDNVEALARDMNLGGLLHQLVRLLLHGATQVETKRMIKAPVKEKPATELPMLPPDLLAKLLTYAEPERSSHWLRACFEEDADSDITQIALWQAYQSRFLEHQTPGHAILPAAEFIKHISATFANASAQVLQGPLTKFIIKGIRPRHLPMSPDGQVYERCTWRVAEKTACGAFALTAEGMWRHILDDHLHVPKHPDGRYDSTEQPDRRYLCRWGSCHAYAREGTTKAMSVAMHIKMHLPDPKRKPGDRPVKGPNAAQEAEYQTQVHYNTAVDERGDAAGLPLTAALVLRNLARNMPKERGEPPGEGGTGTGTGCVSMRDLFAPVLPQLWYVFAHNRPLAGYMADLVATVNP